MERKDKRETWKGAYTMAFQADQFDIIVDTDNKRLKVHRYDPQRITELVAELERLSGETEATKHIIYAKKADVAAFLEQGFLQEGRIDGFFNGENAYMLSRFVTEERATSVNEELAEANLAASLAKTPAAPRPLPDKYELLPATEADAAELAALYGLVFATYPTPMNDPAYVLKTMRNSTYYYVVRTAGRIVCAASAEVDPAFGSAELTDCATHPDFLGQGLLQPIFVALEEKMAEMGIYYLYTLTRAQSAGMNITAAKQGYTYRGRLVNNCTIFSGYEDMNIWVKSLKDVWE